MTVVDGRCFVGVGVSKSADARVAGIALVAGRV